MFQIIVDILLVCLILYGFVAAIFWFRRKSLPTPTPGAQEQGRSPGSQPKSDD